VISQKICSFIFVLMPLLSLAAIAGCKVSASASGSFDAGGDVEGDASASASAESTTVRVRHEGDQLVHVDGEINFDTDKATLKGRNTQTTLRAYANVLRDYPEVALRIEGHTDSRGSDTHNHNLSDARAQAVRQWLIDYGEIAEDRLTAVGRGEDAPKIEESRECKNRQTSKAPESCEEEVWSHNRRSEFHITEGADSLPNGDVTETRSSTSETSASKDGPGFSSGPYIYLSPAFFRVPVADRDETDARQISYRWGLGAGYLWRRNRFAAALGLGFAHVPVTIDGTSDRCTAVDCGSAHDFVLDAELRLGGGSRKLVGYGLLGPGVAIGRSRINDTGFTTGGFAIDIGAGLWGLVWRGLFLGGEVAVNVAAYGDKAGAFHDAARSTGLDLRFLLGWHFGWKK
jgi:outer membrane protein OmpA-like peptidoglycan-associated protein